MLSDREPSGGLVPLKARLRSNFSNLPILLPLSTFLTGTRTKEDDADVHAIAMKGRPSEYNTIPTRIVSHDFLDNSRMGLLNRRIPSTCSLDIRVVN